MSASWCSEDEKVCGHEELEGDVGGDGELGHLLSAVRVLDPVHEVLADLAEDVGGDLLEADLVRLVLPVLARTAQHCLDGSRCECGLPLDEELVVVGGDELEYMASGPS